MVKMKCGQPRWHAQIHFAVQRMRFELVTLNGGWIWLDSSRKSESTFYFTLPVFTIETNDSPCPGARPGCCARALITTESVPVDNEDFLAAVDNALPRCGQALNPNDGFHSVTTITPLLRENGYRWRFKALSRRQWGVYEMIRTLVLPQQYQRFMGLQNQRMYLPGGGFSP